MGAPEALSTDEIRVVLSLPKQQTDIPTAPLSSSGSSTGVARPPDTSHVRGWIHTEIDRLLADIERTEHKAAALVLVSKEVMTRVLRTVYDGASRLFAGVGTEIHAIAHAVLEQRVGQPSPRGIPSPCLAALNATRACAFLFLGGGEMRAARLLLQQV